MKDRTFLRIYAGAGAVYLILSGCFLSYLFFRSEDIGLRSAAVCFAVLAFLLGWLLLCQIRKKLSAFAEGLCARIDNMVNGGKDDMPDCEPETLAAKLDFKMKRLYQIHLQSRERLKAEKQEIQELISDISHQVKTPLSNLKMYNSTLMERSLSPEKEHEFLSLMDTQISKLDFLIQSMVKASQLEAGIIELKVKPSPIYDTVARALGGIVLPAEKKGIKVSVLCDQAVVVPHDVKWTAEALFNLLDNAVKYTDPGGRVGISVEKWKIYTKIDISDTGRGIPENRWAQIFQRFYRGEEVHDIPGVGLGLYLSREIVSKQRGYIQVKSEVAKGSTFSVFLPNESI
jgi:signal transduction histidine kinase